MKRLILAVVLFLVCFSANAQQSRSPRTVAELPANTIDCSNWRKTDGVQQWIAHDPAKPFDFGTNLGWKVDAVESRDFFLSADGVTLYHALELKCGGRPN